MVQNVTHAQVYSQINDGDLMYVSNFDHILARAIQFATKSSFSHVAICFWMTAPGGDKRLMVVEAQGGTTLRVQDFDFYCRRPLAIVAAPKPFAGYESIALARVGEVPYGYIEALYVGLRDFCWDYLGIHLPQKNFRGEICSEFVGRCLGLDSSDISPQDLFNEIGAPIKFNVNG